MANRSYAEWRKQQEGFYPFDIRTYPRRQERAAEEAWNAARQGWCVEGASKMLLAWAAVLAVLLAIAIGQWWH